MSGGSVLLGPLFCPPHGWWHDLLGFSTRAWVDEVRSYKIQQAVRSGFMRSSSELFQKGNLIPVIFLPQFGEPVAPRANCLHLARCLTWPLCQVQTVLELMLLPGAATCRVRDRPPPPASPPLGGSAMWFLGLPRVVLRLLCDKGNLVCAACLPRAWLTSRSVLQSGQLCSAGLDVLYPRLQSHSATSHEPRLPRGPRDSSGFMAEGWHLRLVSWAVQVPQACSTPLVLLAGIWTWRRHKPVPSCCDDSLGTVPPETGWRAFLPPPLCVWVWGGYRSLLLPDSSSTYFFHFLPFSPLQILGLSRRRRLWPLDLPRWAG